MIHLITIYFFVGHYNQSRIKYTKYNNADYVVQVQYNYLSMSLYKYPPNRERILSIKSVRFELSPADVVQPDEFTTIVLVAVVDLEPLQAVLQLNGNVERWLLLVWP